MNLNDFERDIDPRILERGRKYSREGCVLSLRESSPNRFVADVAGTGRYTVTIALDDTRSILESGCDCPYTSGPYCKHQAAVLLAIRDRFDRQSGGQSVDQSGEQSDGQSDAVSAGPDAPGAKAAARKPKTTAHKTPDDDAPDPLECPPRSLEAILSQRKPGELVRLLLDAADQHDDIRRRIELEFGSRNEQDELMQATRLIRACIRDAADRQGFVAWRNTAAATRCAWDVLEKARTARRQRRVVHALDLSLGVLREMMKLLEKCDDSDGNVGGTIDESLAVAREIAAGLDRESGIATEKPDQKAVFTKLLAEAAHSRYDGWPDWRISLLASCAILARDPALYARLDKYLVTLEASNTKDSWSARRDREQIAQIRYQMIARHGGPEAAEAFIAANLEYPAFRRMAIEAALAASDSATALRLAQDGEQADSEMRGLVHEWRTYRYKAHQCAGQIDQQRATALLLIGDGDFDYYLELRRTYRPEEWPAVYASLIRGLDNKENRWSGTYTRILVEENDKARLLQFVKRNPLLVEQFGKHLLPEYRNDVYELYVSHIEQSAAEASNRKQYQGVCGIIRKLEQMGGQEPAAAIRKKLAQQYANRPAMLDELARG